LGGLTILYLLFSDGGEAIPFAANVVSALHDIRFMSDIGVFLVPIGLLILSAVLKFLSDFHVVRFSTLYSKIALQDLYSALYRASHWPRGEATRDFSDAKALNRIQRNAIMVSSRVLRVFHALWVPLMMFFGGLSLLFLIDLEFAFIISVVLAFIMLLIGVAGVYASQNSAKWERASSAGFRQLNIQMDRVVSSGGGGSTDVQKWRSLDNLVRLLKGRILAVAYTRLAVSFGMIISLLVVLGYVANEGKNISGLLIVVVLLVRVFISLKGIASSLTVINRFYPQLRRYYRLLEVLRGEGVIRQTVVPPDSSVRVIVTDLANNKLNRLRWRWLLYEGEAVEFCEGGDGGCVSLRGTSDGLVDVEGEVWLDLKAMGNAMPIKVPRAEVGDRVARLCNNDRPEKINSSMDDDDFDD
jgi:ABC-type multidrug transport system fused ATPase/permease subunit